MSNVLSLEEFFSTMQEKGEDGTSRYQLRNENNQQRSRISRFPKLKKENKKKSKLLVVSELAIPFNPKTGKPDEIYNEDHKFRPTLSASTVALMLKKFSNENAEAKDTFMHKAGLDSWDTSNVEVLTEEDKAVFGKYRVPRIFSFPVVNINIPVMTGQYGQDYTISVQRDPMTDEIVGEKPLAIQANEFFRALAYEEVSKYDKDVENGLIDHTEKQQKEHKREIFGRNPVSNDYVSNWIIAVELPLNNSYELNDVRLSAFDSDAIKKQVVITKYGKGIREGLAKYMDGSWRKFDKYFDFWEIDMACPTSSESPAELGLNTSFEKPQESIYDEDGFEKFLASYLEFTDGVEDLEKQIVNSVRIPAYTPEVESILAASLPSVIDINSEYLTDSVIKNYRDFITLILGEEGDNLLLDVEMGTSEKEAGSFEEDAAKKASSEATKDLDLDAMLNDDIDLDEIDTDSITLDQAVNS